MHTADKISIEHHHFVFNYSLISAGVLAFHAFLPLPSIMCSILFPCHFTLLHIIWFKTNLWASMFWFLCMCGLHGLSPTSGESFISIAPLEIYLLREIVTCSILISPAVLKLFTWRNYHSNITKKLVFFCISGKQFTWLKCCLQGSPNELGSRSSVSRRNLNILVSDDLRQIQYLSFDITFVSTSCQQMQKDNKIVNHTQLLHLKYLKTPNECEISVFSLVWVSGATHVSGEAPDHKTEREEALSHDLVNLKFQAN